MKLWLCSFATLLFALPVFAVDADTISWKKTVLDEKFRSEGVAISDVNKDGKKDVMVGEFWYEAPNWTRHEMQPPGNYGDGLNGYSKVFCVWADDLNADGYPDAIVIDFPGAPCYWLENPKGDSKTHWKRHMIWHSACNETPTYVDLFGTGKKVLVMGFQPKGKDNEGQMAYFTPKADDPTATWTMHPISEPSTPPELKDGKPVRGTGYIQPGTFRFAHGLGIGDINKDKRHDVITIGGWWEQPEKTDGKTAWKFHPTSINDACADMYVFDVDNDGAHDIISTSAHKFGIWWHKQRGNQEHPAFDKQEIFKELVSETHAAHFQDINGDGNPDLITGKRWWSHGKREPGWDQPARIYWFEVTRAKDGMAEFTPHVIDEDSGIGTQFVVDDLNGDGLLDVVSSNKKGVRVILQERK